jgi:hypothetical protein
MFHEGSPGSGIPVFPNRRDWGPEQAIGEPRYYGGTCGDYPTAWSPLKPNDGIQWLELHYPRKVTAIGVSIWETFNPGAVIRVTTFDASGNESTAWEGDDPVQTANRGWGISPIRFTQPVDTQRIRLYLDTDKVEGWNAIEAVSLHSKGGGKYWAIDAEASSSYTTEPKPQSFVFTYEGPLTEIKYDKGYNDGVHTVHATQQVIEMKRSKDTPYLNTVRILKHHDGNSISGENVKISVLDTDMNVLYKIDGKFTIRQYGTQWFTFEFPSVEVPETFRIASPFGNTYRICAENEAGHSFVQSIAFIQDADSEKLLPLKQENSVADWMIRAYLSETPQAKR